MKIVECVPNFSEGRDRSKVESIAAAAGSVRGVHILDLESDTDHHRSVLTFAGPPEAVLEAAFRAASKASAIIDLTSHRGEHPRMGATDVIPFIPVCEASMEDCVRLARALGERIGRELHIPVFLYGFAAARKERADLVAVRRGQFEGLRSSIGTDPDRTPDYGPNQIHPTAGAIAVGARDQIVNFNFNLDLKDIQAGQAIAKAVRTSGGGLPHLRAKEIRLSSGLVQVSTVLTNYQRTSMAMVFDAVQKETSKIKGSIISTEIVGLLPRQSLVDCAIAAMRVEGFNPSIQILEDRLASIQEASRSASDWQESAKTFTAALASSDPTPGGGAAAAISGAMGSGLGQMAAEISLKSGKLDPRAKETLEQAYQEFSESRIKFLELGREDAQAFGGFMEVFKLPKSEPRRKERVQESLLRAAQVPLETTRLAAKLRLRAMDLVRLSIESVGSDMRCAAELLRCAALCAAENVRINTRSLADKSKADTLEEDLKEILTGI